MSPRSVTAKAVTGPGLFNSTRSPAELALVVPKAPARTMDAATTLTAVLSAIDFAPFLNFLIPDLEKNSDMEFDMNLSPYRPCRC